MENKHQQPHNGSSRNTNQSSSNKPASASTQQPVNDSVDAASIPATSASTADTSRATSQPSGSSAAEKSQESTSTTDRTSQPEGQQKSWLDQQQWLKNIDVNQLPQQLKDFSSKAAEQVNKLTPTQKVIGGALLVSGLSWLALRSKSSGSASKGEEYQPYRGTKDASSKWKSSTESVYRGATHDLADDDYASDL